MRVSDRKVVQCGDAFLVVKYEVGSKGNILGEISDSSAFLSEIDQLPLIAPVGIFHPLFPPIIIFILLIAGCVAVLS